MAVLLGSNSTLNPEIWANLPVPPPVAIPVDGSIRDTAFSITSCNISGATSGIYATLLGNGNTSKVCFAVIEPGGIVALIPPPFAKATSRSSFISSPKSSAPSNARAM